MKITIDGYFNQNLGDDLFFTLLASRYPEHDFYAWSWYELPIKTKNLHTRYNRLENKLLKRASIEKRRFKDTELLVEIGGSIFMEGISQNQDWSKAGKPFYILGANFGPVKSTSYIKEHEKLFQKAQDVCFRDASSKALFHDSSADKKIRREADIAFLLGKELDFQTLARSKKKQLFISLMHFENEKINESYLSFVQKQIDLYQDRGYKILLCAFHPLQKDTLAFERLKISQNDLILSYDGSNLTQILKELAQSKLVIATRFHAIILGLAAKANVLPILYGEKSEHLLLDLGFEPVLFLDRLNQISDEQIEQAWISLNPEQIASLAESAEKQFQILDRELGRVPRKSA